MTRIVPPLHERHAPTTLQEAFYAALEAYEDWELDQPEPTVLFDDKDVPISSIFGRMRNSDDIVPEKVRLLVPAELNALVVETPQTDVTYSVFARPLRELALERLREAGDFSAAPP